MQDNRQHVKGWHIVFTILLCVMVFCTVSAQNDVEQYADSLLRKARKASTAASKIEGLLNLSIFWVDHDTVKARQYLDEARRTMGKSPTDYQQGLYELYHANILMDFEPQRAKAAFVRADSLLAKDTSAKSYSYRSKLWNNYGVVLQLEDNSAAFMEIIVNKTIPYARLAGDSAQVGYQLQNMGMLMSNLSNYAKAADYYDQALQTLQFVHGREQDRLDIFVNAAKNALLMNDLTPARIYLDSAKLYIRRLPPSTVSVPTYYRTELTYFKHLGNKTQVLENYRKGITAAQERDDKYLLKELDFELSSFYRDRGNYEKAKEHLLLSHTRQPYTRLQNRAVFQRELAQLEYHLGNYKAAYGYMDSLRVTMDSLYQKDVASKVLHFEQQYKSAERENHILRLETKNREQELAIAKNRWWTLALGSGLVLALCIAGFSWKISRNNKKLLTQNELLHAEELNSLRQQERLGQYDAMLQGQEAERSRLAKDLHDGLGGLLAGVKLKLSSVITKSGAHSSADRNAVQDVVHQLDYSMDELRRIAHNMMPESLRYVGLVSALSDLCRYMSTPIVQVIFQNLGIEDNYTDQLRVTVYRVVQELLTNAIKHAHADEIIVQCSELDNHLFITVEDNGKGMDTTVINQDKGLGLVNIQNRISLLNGHIETLSQPEEGTTINIQIPLS